MVKRDTTKRKADTDHRNSAFAMSIKDRTFKDHNFD